MCFWSVEGAETLSPKACILKLGRPTNYSDGPLCQNSGKNQGVVYIKMVKHIFSIDKVYSSSLIYREIICWERFNPSGPIQIESELLRIN